MQTTLLLLAVTVFVTVFAGRGPVIRAHVLATASTIAGRYRCARIRRAIRLGRPSPYEVAR